MKELFTKAYRHWSEDNATRHAAALAFYAMLALAPLIVFAIAVGSQFLDSGALRDQIMAQTRSELGPKAAELLQGVIFNTSKTSASTWAGALSLILALFGSSAVFDQLDLSVNSIWGAPPRKGGAIKNFLILKLLSVISVLIFVALILTWLGLDAVIGFLKHQVGAGDGIWTGLSFVVSVAFLSGVFGLAFRLLPRAEIEWSDVWLPALVSATGFAIAKYLFSLYFSYAHVGAAYGSAGAVVVILLWIYYSAQIFFFGIEMTFVRSGGDTSSGLERS